MPTITSAPQPPTHTPGDFVEEKWGDKWEERFGAGRGGKSGEEWRQGHDGSSYSRHWGEDHLGDGWVRKHGHSTHGEHWDSTEQTGTYYEPTPHFTFDMALTHSPELLGVRTLPRGAAAPSGGGAGASGGGNNDNDDPFGGGIDSL